MELASAAEITRASYCCWTTVLMNCTCAEPLASVGPVWSHVAPSSWQAFFAPVNAASKYGMLTALGRIAILRPLLTLPPPPEPPPDAGDEPPPLSSAQELNVSTAAAATASAPRNPDRMVTP